MNKAIKFFLATILAAVIIVVGAYFITGDKVENKVSQPAGSAQTAPTNQIIPAPEPEPANTAAKPDSALEISGKIRSINEKAVYIELADGKGFAANINPSIPVITQGVTKPGTLVDLKAGQNVTVKVDSVNNAIEILINK